MNKEIIQAIKDLNIALAALRRKMDTAGLVEFREPREHAYSPYLGMYDITDTFELKDAVAAILDHLNLRLSKTKNVPEKTVLVKKDAPPTP